MQASYLAPVVQRLDNAIHRINCYPADKYRQNKPRYPLDSDLSGGWSYPAFEQPGPGVLLKLCRLNLGCAKKKFIANLRSYRLSVNDSSPIFGTQNDIFNNPKQQTLNFSYQRKFEVTIQCGLKAFRTDNLPKRSVGCPMAYQ